MKPGVDHIGVCVTFFCHDGNGRFLLHKRSPNCRDEQGRWDFGGGQLEHGEQFEEAVVREVMEEYGCVGEIQKQLPPLSVVREGNDKKTHWVSIGFIVKVDPKEAHLNEPFAMDQIGWFGLDQLPTPLHSAINKRFTKQKHHFKKYLTKA